MEPFDDTVILSQSVSRNRPKDPNDAQGSLVALVDENGNVVRRYAYDPWGKRVKPTNWTQPDTSEELYHINRGYTMHEHLDDFELINMNGRVFDPAVAQFLSPDNYVQDPYNWLNYNRYAYCLNNPLKYTDPSGEAFCTSFTITTDFVFSIFKSVGKLLDKDINGLRKVWRDFDPSAPWSKTNKAMRIDNGLFQTDESQSIGAQVWQLVSRFTWELPQTIIGYCVMHGYNLLGKVDRVDYYGGATFCTDEYSVHNGRGLTLGPYIKADINDGLNADFHDYLIGNNRYSAVYMHEYGHYIQSQITGPLCLPIVDSYSFIQTIIKNGTYQIYKGKRVHRSNFGWTEIWANRLSSSYFWEHEGLDWCGLGYDTNFPIDWSACN